MKVLSKLRESTSASMKLKVDNELLIIMMCHCRFIPSKKKKKKKQYRDQIHQIQTIRG